MRKPIAVKTLFRSPFKTLLTFLLIAAASFALFSRITDYAVTAREVKKAESFYNGVAALDTSMPPISGYEQEPKPWPSEEELEKFSSLPGVTLADTRYMTDGLVENYKRVIDPDAYSAEAEFVLEGIYAGFEETESGNGYINFTDITVFAGEIKPDPRFPMKIRVIPDESFYKYNPYSKSFFEELKKGSRCLVVGSYSAKSGSAFELGSLMTRLETQIEGSERDVLRVIDGLEEDYLETEEFAWYKQKIEAAKQDSMVYDIVYTSDMRAIPYVNEHRLVISEGYPLTAEETDACVVSELFLDTYGLSVGDMIHIEFGDTLWKHFGNGGMRGKTAWMMSDFIASADLEIIGAYRFTDSASERYIDNSEWSYGPAAVFVPSSLLPVEVPDDYENQMGDFSVFVENPLDIDAFRAAAEQMAAELGLGLRFSDGGWQGMKNSFVTGPLISCLTTALYVTGAALALLLAVYLYIGRNKQSYAIMRTLGVTSRKAGNSIAIPFYLLSAFAMAAGGIAGLGYASYTAAKTLAGMSNSSAPDGYVYVLDAAIPAGVVIFCMILELAFTSLILMLFLQKMKKTSPWELLQAGAVRTGMHMRKTRKKKAPDIADTSPVPAGIDMEKVSACGKIPVHGKYGALRQTRDYMLRHMRRSIGKTAVSLALMAVLAAGIGMFVLARNTYRDACREVSVTGVATGFSSTSVTELVKSELVKDFYYYSNGNVRVNNVGVLSPITFSNDFDHYLDYLEKDYKITYARGYDASVFERTGAVCLMGQKLAETLDVHAGDDITLMSDNLYSFMTRLHEEGGDFEFYKDEDEFLAALERAGKLYKVAGILECEDEAVSMSIFSVANYAAENLYSQPFEVGYCEFNLADNRNIMELDSLLQELKNQYMEYAPQAMFHMDSETLEHVQRVRNLLEALFPIAVAAAVLIGLFGPGLIIMQSAQETACMRILGMNRTRVRCILVLEQAALCMISIILVAVFLALLGQERFGRSIETLAFCWMLFVLGCICGAFAAAVRVTRYKVLELLQVKE